MATRPRDAQNAQPRMTEAPSTPVPCADAFDAMVAAELDRDHADYRAMVDTHGAYAVIVREVKEFEGEIFRSAHTRSRSRMLGALVRIAAMARWAAMDLRLLDG